MSNKKILGILFVVAFCSSLSITAFARDLEEGIPLSKVPDIVIDAVENGVMGIKVLDAKKLTKDTGEIIYLIDGAVGQKSYEVMVDSQGNLIGDDVTKKLKTDVPLSSVPGNIVLAARGEIPGLKILEVKIISGPDQEELYEIEGTVRGKTYKVVISLSGSVMGSGVYDKYVENGEIVYGEYKTGAEAKEARAFVKEHQPNADFELLDNEVNKVIWTFANLFPGCLMMSIDGIRQKKKFFWDTMKKEHTHWLAANMAGEAFLGFGAFNTKKITGQDTIDFIKFRQNVADSRRWDDEMFAEVLGKPQG